MSPRPPAPCSLAPGLLLSRRPAPRRLLAVVALAVLVIAAAVPVVSADEILTDNLYVDISPGIEFYCKGDDQSTNYAYPVNMLRFSPEMAEFDRFSTIALAPQSAIGNYNSLPQSGHTAVEFYDINLATPIKKGSGEYGYFKYMVGDVGWLNIYVDYGDLEVGNLYVKSSGHGSKVKMTSASTGFVFPTVKVTDTSSQKLLSTYISSQNPYIVCFAAGRTVSGNDLALSPIQDFVTYTTIHNTWKNRLVISDVSTPVKNLTKIEIYRDFDNKQHTSTQIIADKYYTSEQLTDLYTTVTLQNDARPALISIQNPLSSRWFNTTLSGDTVPPPSDTTSSVTVYIQNSQTGALLANANLAILAAAGGTETEIINQTLPGGTATYSLQPTGGGSPNPDYYRAVATVPGYTQIVENHSFTLSGPHDVIIEMRPDTGGPTDPDRAYLEFYVRDLNANGIPSASVQCAGMIRQTNSKGYLVIEVAKNATYPYVVKKSGYVTIEGTATVADGPRYVANVVLGPGTVPTYTPTPGPSETPGGPGATPTPDTRTNEQKGQAIIDLIADFAEPIAILAILATIFGLMKMMTPGRR